MKSKQYTFAKQTIIHNTGVTSQEWTYQSMIIISDMEKILGREAK